MSINALKYQLNEYYADNNPALLYYDFENNSVDAFLSGSVYQAYLQNKAPSNQSGIYYGKIKNATGISSSQAISTITGTNKFLNSGIADFTKTNIEISGSSNLDLKNCSYLFSLEPNLSKDGVIFGCFDKVTGSITGMQVVSSKGFNFGINSRGKLFLQSISRDGEYCFVANEIELAKKNIIGLSFSNSEASILRFDYLNDQIYSQEFSLDTSHIKNNNIYIGSSNNFYRNSGENLYSGKMDDFIVLSGKASPTVLYEIGKSFISDYYFTSGSVSAYQTLSGFVPTFIYKTGITGSYLNITGYTTVKSGISIFSLSGIFTGNISIKEGDRYYQNFGDYLEEQGFLDNSFSNSYSPTGEDAFSTLGLQNSSSSFSGYSISGIYSSGVINTPLYEVVNLYGTTSEISGVINTPVYNTGYITGADVSGIQISGNFSDFQKNYIYFMGER